MTTPSEPGWYPDPDEPIWYPEDPVYDGPPAQPVTARPKPKRGILFWVLALVAVLWLASQCASTKKEAVTSSTASQTGRSATEDAAYAASIKQSILDAAGLASTSQACAEGIAWICVIADVKTSTPSVAIVTVQVTADDKQFGEEIARNVYNFALASHPALRSVQVNNAEGKVLASKTFSTRRWLD